MVRARGERPTVSRKCARLSAQQQAWHTRCPSRSVYHPPNHPPKHPPPADPSSALHRSAITRWGSSAATPKLGDSPANLLYQPKKKTSGFPSQFIKSTKVLMATPQGRRLGYHKPEQVSNQEPPDSRLGVLTTTLLGGVTKVLMATPQGRLGYHTPDQAYYTQRGRRSTGTVRGSVLRPAVPRPAVPQPAAPRYRRRSRVARFCLCVGQQYWARGILGGWYPVCLCY